LKRDRGVPRLLITLAPTSLAGCTDEAQTSEEDLPLPREFSIELRTVKKQCFGSDVTLEAVVTDTWF